MVAIILESLWSSILNVVAKAKYNIHKLSDVLRIVIFSTGVTNFLILNGTFCILLNISDPSCIPRYQNPESFVSVKFLCF